MKEIIKYQCNFCSSSFSSKKSCKFHETEECLKNPKLKNCKTCKNFEIKITNYCDLSEIRDYYCNVNDKLPNVFIKNCKDWIQK